MASLAIVFGLSAVAFAGAIPESHLLPRDTFNWGTIGDSWASGVAYSTDTEWDGNANGCQRINQAWSVDLLNDNSWTVNPQSGVFNGCSGSILVDMHGYGKQGRQLINAVGSPQVVFMSAGGNNAFFGTVAEKCIFTPDPRHNYGKAYDDDPDCTGECCQWLRNADNYINQQGDGGLAQDLLNTINDIMTTPQANSQPDFFLYVLGYAQFFSPDMPTGSDTCDEWTFAPWFSYYKPKLTSTFRTRLNDLVTNFNQVYQNVINPWLPPNPPNSDTNQYVVYVDIDDSFNNYRFCEPGATRQQQWTGQDVWLWNLQYTNTQDPTPTTGLEPNMWDMFTTLSDTDWDAEGQAISQDLDTDSGSGSGNDDSSTGYRRRPFHPKAAGHTAIKNALVFQMQAAGMPGIVPPAS